MKMIENDIMKKIEKQKDRISNILAEKRTFLGEYKERVLLALTKEEVEEKLVYPEVERAIKTGLADKMLLSRLIDMKFLKKYMKLAEANNLKYKLVDEIHYEGEVALVLASNDYLKDQVENPILKSRLERIREKGLPDVYYDAIGKKISDKYMEVIEKLLPELKDEYLEMSFWDRLCGQKCILEEKLGGSIYG